MKNELNEQKIDEALKRIVSTAALDARTADEIADSPRLRWAVQSAVRRQNEAPRRGWLPMFDWRIAVFAAFAAIVSLVAFAAFRPSQPAIVAVGSGAAFVEVVDLGIGERHSVADSVEAVPVAGVRRTPAASKASPRRAAKKASSVPLPENVEFKSDFIALTYSGVPESGHVVSVKVPRAMMVSLGVSNKAENGAEYVRAEVLMGDDGTARAIRFVQ